MSTRVRCGLRLVGYMASCALLATACSDTAPTPAFEEWQAEADRVCSEYSARFDELAQPDSATEAVAVLEMGLQLTEDQLDAFEALGTPDERSESIERFLDLLAERAQVTEELLEASQHDGEAVIQRILTRGDQIELRLDEMAAELGLSSCRRSVTS